MASGRSSSADDVVGLIGFGVIVDPASFGDGGDSVPQGLLTVWSVPQGLLTVWSVPQGLLTVWSVPQGLLTV